MAVGIFSFLLGRRMVDGGIPLAGIEDALAIEVPVARVHANDQRAWTTIEAEPWTELWTLRAVYMFRAPEI